MNVPPALYALESGLWDSRRGQSAGHGPSAHIRVEGDQFYGEVQMNPRMRVVRAAQSAAGASVSPPEPAPRSIGED
jgi:hypothetical protein